MGNVFRRPVSNLEKLGRLAEKINHLEKSYFSLQEKRELWVENFMAYGTGIYFLSGGLTYILGSKEGQTKRKFYMLFYALLPLALILIKELIIWVFNLRLGSTTSKLNYLRKRKKEVIDLIVKTEPLNSIKARIGRIEKSRSPILSKKGTLEKFFGFIAGEGASSRYALICSGCSFHNGLIPREEYDYVSFRCRNCNFFNPARVIRLPSYQKLGYESGMRKFGNDSVQFKKFGH